MMSACKTAADGFERVAALCSRAAGSARSVKPVRALLDLTDVDEWIAQAWRAGWRKLPKMMRA